MHHVLGHRQGALPYVDTQQQRALGVHGGPHPVRRPGKTCDGLGLAAFPGLDRTEHGVELIQLHLAYVEVTQEMP